MKWVIGVLIFIFITLGLLSQFDLDEMPSSSPPSKTFFPQAVSNEVIETETEKDIDLLNEKVPYDLTDEQWDMMDKFEYEYGMLRFDTDVSKKKKLIEDMAKSSLGKTFYLSKVVEKEILDYASGESLVTSELCLTYLLLLNEKERDEVYDNVLYFVGESDHFLTVEKIFRDAENAASLK